HRDCSPPVRSSDPTRRSSDLSVTLWNEHSAGEAAQAVLKRALQLKLPVDARRRLLEDKKGLDKAVQDRTQHIESEKADLKKLVRSEEHTSELQSRENLVCRLL